MRSFTATQVSALRAVRVRMCYLIHVSIAKPGATTINLYFTTASHSITHTVPGHNSAEWLGFGRLLDIQFAQEDASLEVHNAEVTLDGLDPTIISLALNEPLEHAPVTFYLLVMDPDTNQAIGTATQFYRGTMSNIRILAPSGSDGGGAA